MIIACRNGAATLGETLDGLAAQRWDRPWEIVLADNGSTDASVALFGAAACGASGDPHAGGRCLRTPGKPFALNTAHRRGPGAGGGVLRRRRRAGRRAGSPPWAAALAEHGIVACRIDFDRLNGGWIRWTRGEMQHAGLEHLAFLPELVHAGGGTMGVQRRVVDEIGGFDADFAYLEDTEFSLRAQIAGHAILFVPEAVMHVRARADLKLIFRQNYNWGRYEMKLVSRYRDRGVAFAGGWQNYFRTGGSSCATTCARGFGRRRSPCSAPPGCAPGPGATSARSPACCASGCSPTVGSAGDRLLARK